MTFLSLSHTLYRMKSPKKRFEWILSRGATARGLANVPGLSTLTRSEIDYDLRHLRAYANAVDNYQQTVYIHANPHLDLQQPVSNNNNNKTTMPIKIDPEEEKRRAVLLKTISRAEDERAQLEQEYMALRAHFVYTSQALAKATEERDRSLKILQEACTRAGRNVGCLRARLQMCRDVLACLQHRNQLLGEEASKSDVTPVVTEEMEKLCSIWNELEPQKCKRQTVSWAASKMPATPEGVPLLLSTLSLVPEKSVAFGYKDELVWLSSHLPATEDDCAAKMEADDDDDLDSLRDQAALLELEYARELQLNGEVLNNLAKLKPTQDNSVCMMGLLRQATEGVLHRHNVVVTSEGVPPVETPPKEETKKRVTSDSTSSSGTSPRKRRKM